MKRKLQNSTHILGDNIVTQYGVTTNGVLDSILDLLATYTHDSELQATTAPMLISTVHKSPQHPLSLFQPCFHQPLPGTGF
jgi:hypothetical protein